MTTFNENVSINIIIENLPNLIYWKDLNFTYQGCNTNVAKILGYSSPSEVIGKTDYDLAKEFHWSNDKINKINKSDSLIIEKGIEISEEESIEINDLIKIYLTKKKPLYENGKIIGILGVSTDITDRKDIEKKLKSIEEKNEIYLHGIVENLPELVYWKDKNLIYQGCNNLCANMLNLKNPAEIVGKSDKDFGWSKERIEELHNIDKEILKHGILRVVEDIIPIKNSKRIFLTSKAPLIDKNNNIIGILGISTDITDRIKLEEELKRSKIAAEAANRAKTEFIANMSHDIRTPLTGVIGISDILENLEENSKLKQYAHDIHDCGQQLLAMLNSILDVVSAENLHEKDKVIGEFNLQECIQEIVNLEKPTTILKNLALVVYIDPKIPTYLINDKNKINRILLNLFSNAVKFTENGSITLKAQLLDIKNDKAKIRFSVTDTGIGIPKDQQNKVFDRFFRASPSYKGQYTGHGVGLHIAQSCAKLLGGEIKVISQEGIGTTFYVDLNSPISYKDVTQQKLFTNIEKNLPTTNLSCLLIEDNPIAIKVLESIISDAGLKYESKMDGESALQTAKTQLFDFIITDIGLPKMSGYDFVKNYRQWEKQNHKNPIPIFALTAHANDEIKKSCLTAGINDIFTKPFSIHALNTILAKYIKINSSNLNLVAQTDITSNLLGPDLPKTEEELFLLNNFCIFDSQKALSFLGNDINILKNILKTMINDEIPNEKIQLQTAYLSKNWNIIEKLAHKIKGGAVYIGTEKLKFACQYLERYNKAGHKKLLERLYEQMMMIIDETCQEILKYLQ